MSGSFLMACLILAVLAGILFLIPGRGSARSTAAREDRRRVLTALYQGRRRELDAEIAAGLADAETARSLKTELDASLLDDVAATAEVEAVNPGAGPRWPAVVLALVLPLLAFLIYHRIGNPEAEVLRDARVVLDLADDHADVEAWRERLEARVERRPEEAESWYLLGHVLLKQQKYARAAESFSRAKDIVGHDIAIETYWLQARYLAADGNVDEESIRIAEDILSRDPANYAVLQLLSVHKARTGDFKGSLALLYKARNTPLPAEREAALENFIHQVRAHVPVTMPTIDVAVTAGQGGEGAPAVAVPPHSILFVIARPPGGGMPYAVARHSASLLPIEVRLDDLASMNPANPISAAEQVEVVVRLSLTGQPAAAPGDWSWTSSPIDVRDMKEPVRLEVNLVPPAED